jgi:hypothetical protein
MARSFVPSAARIANGVFFRLLLRSLHAGLGATRIGGREKV